jgi:hypothetical protein
VPSSASAFWRQRSESLEEWAGRAETFFRLLAECHPSYARWDEEARTAEESLQRGFEPTREAFARLFGRSKSRFAEGGFLVLARPDDALFLVRQCSPESDDVEVDRDPAHMQPLPAPAPL